jgi:hypothetical protein
MRAPKRFKSRAYHTEATQKGKMGVLDENRVCQHLANIPYSLGLLVGTTGFEPAKTVVTTSDK